MCKSVVYKLFYVGLLREQKILLHLHRTVIDHQAYAYKQAYACCLTLRHLWASVISYVPMYTHNTGQQQPRDLYPHTTQWPFEKRGFLFLRTWGYTFSDLLHWCEYVNRLKDILPIVHGLYQYHVTESNLCRCSWRLARSTASQRPSLVLWHIDSFNNLLWHGTMGSWVHTAKLYVVDICQI